MCRNYSASVFSKYRDDLGNGYHYVDDCYAGVEITIVGGNDSLPKEFPHMVFILLTKYSQYPVGSTSVDDFV